MVRWCVVLSVVVACGSDSDDLPAEPAELSALEPDLTFGATVTGQASTATLHLENTGATASGPIATTVSGDFALDAAGTTCQGLALTPDAGCDVVVVFQPTVTGPRSGVLTITANPGGTLSIPLAGEALTNTLTLELDPMVANFGPTDVGSTDSVTIQITNPTTLEASLESITTTGPFAIASQTCGPTLAGGASCDVAVTFAPALLGGVDGSLVVATDFEDFSAQLHGTGTSSLTIAHNGSGTGTITSTPAGIDCGTTCTASFSEPVLLTAVATGGSTFAGWSDPSCTGSTCTVTPTTSARAITASFAAASTGVFVSPGSLDFGTVDTTNGPFATLQLVNNTTSPLAIDSIVVTGAGFGFISTNCGIALAAASTCDVVVRLLSESLGSLTGTLDITVAGQHHVAQLAGVGQRPITVIVQGGGRVISTPAGIDCGSTCTALFSQAVTLTAIPDAGNVLNRWSSCDATITCENVDPGTSVTAEFVTLGTPILNVSYAGDTSGELRVVDLTTNTQLIMCNAACAVSLTAGHTIEVTSATISNYGGLTGACTTNGTAANSCQFVVAGSTTLTTHYTLSAAERWTRFLPQAALELAFDAGGNLLVIQAFTVTQLRSTNGSIGWSQQLPVASFAKSPTGLFVASGTTLVFLDANGVLGTSHPFTGTLQFVAPNGNLIGTAQGTGATTEWAPDGTLVRTLTIGPVDGIDSNGTFYALDSTVIDEGGTLVTHFAAKRFSFTGTPLAAFPEVAPDTSNRGCSGFAVGGDHLVGYGCGHRTGQIGTFGWQSHSTTGLLQSSQDKTVSSPGFMFGAAVPAGPSIAFFADTTDTDNKGLVFGWATGSTITEIARSGLHDPIDGIPGISPIKIAGGPNGEVALLGTYVGLFDLTTSQSSGGLFIQALYP
ncbi:MAG: choice-of-anchor D domain-containing protein [Kofleriaceae bacterium]